MKRRNGGSSGALVGAAEERLIFLHDPENGEVGSGDGGFTSMVDDEDEEYGDDQELCSYRRDAGRRGSGAGADQDVGSSGKKRRLSAEQVKALERNFEVENKLEPERKVRLAQELGLQPRQVAVWFQNRRARWKTKQLERDYVQLKANYGALQLSLDSLQADHRALLSEVKGLRAKFAGGDAPCTTAAVKEEPAASESGGKIACSEPDEEVVEPAEAEAEADHEEAPPPVPALQACKDGSSTDSSDDSSAVLNACEDNTSARHVQHHSRDVAGLFPPVHKLQFLGPPPSTAAFHPLGGGGGGGKCYAASATPFYHYGPQQTQQYLQHHLSSPSSPPPATRMVEEHNFLMEDDCGSTFFADEQLSTLPWYSSDQWS